MSVTRAILFGSFARGTEQDSSDIDVLLLSSGFEDVTLDQETRAWTLAKAVDDRIEPILCGRATFEENDWHPLFDVVKREGIEIQLPDDG